MMTNREVPFALPIIPMHILIIRKKNYLKFINGKKNANRSLCRGDSLCSKVYNPVSGKVRRCL